MPEVLDLRELGGDDGRRPTPRAIGVDVDEDTDVDLNEDLQQVAASAPPWRRRAAIAVVVALALGVAYMLTAGRPSNPAAPARPVADAAPPAQRAALHALDAWARFASTGDLAGLDGAFDPAGPQLARLRSEAGALAARPAGGTYRFGTNVLFITTGRNQDEQLVAADVVLSRSGDADQRFAWELVMRRSGPERPWLLWTVRDRNPSTSLTTGGSP